MLPRAHTGSHSEASQPVRAIAKFFQNPDAGSRNTLLSRTFGKCALIDDSWLKENESKANFRIPKEGEFWVVQVIKETHPGIPKGAILVRPEQHIPYSDVTPLLMGQYTVDFSGGIVYIRPKFSGCNWMIPQALRYGIERHCPQKPIATIVTL